MAGFRWCAIGLAMLDFGGVAAGADATVTLRESARAGETTRVLILLKAEGRYRPAPMPGAARPEPVKSLALKVETRLDFAERVMAVDDGGRARRAVRKVVQAASAINGEIRPMSAVLRPEVDLLVAEPRAGAVVVFSPGGPLTRSELEVVQGPGDPLALAALLPDAPVKVGGRWRVGEAAARALSAYDTIGAGTLDAVLEAVNESTARVRLSGTIRGAVLGGEGTIQCTGAFTFDRKAHRVDRLTLRRNETRTPGPVEAGLDVQSTLDVERKTAETPAVLTDDALASVALDPAPDRELLLLAAPNGKYTLLHDRDWHTYWDDLRMTVLKRLDGGTVVAQCNLSIGPDAGKGRHQDLEQFREDIRRALGARFGQFLGVGEVDGEPAGGFRYKVGVQGHEKDVGVLWDYFLVASPDGDQLLATFTLAENRAKSFDDQDLRLIGSLKWTGAREPSPKPRGP